MPTNMSNNDDAIREVAEAYPIAASIFGMLADCGFIIISISPGYSAINDNIGIVVGVQRQSYTEFHGQIDIECGKYGLIFIIGYDSYKLFYDDFDIHDKLGTIVAKMLRY